MSSSGDKGQIKGFKGLKSLGANTEGARSGARTDSPSEVSQRELPAAWVHDTDQVERRRQVQSHTAAPSWRPWLIWLGPLVLVVGGLIWNFSQVPPSRPVSSVSSPSYPTPVGAGSQPTLVREAPGAAVSAAPAVSMTPVTDCRALKYGYRREDGSASTGRVYSYYKNGVRHFSSRMPSVDCFDAPQSTTAAARGADEARASAATQSVAPNGRPWPARAGYIDGYPVMNSDGHSKIVVDNGENSSAIYVKLVDLEESAPSTVRQFYIPSGAKFTANGVRAGRYDVRYMNLSDGRLSRTEEFTVEENSTAGRIEYSILELTLYNVPGGSMKTYALDPTEF